MGNILLTAIGSVAGDIVIKILRQYGHHVVGTDIYPKEWLVNSFCVDSFYQVPRAVEQETFIKAILEICQRENIEYIIPLTDVEVDVFNKFRTSFVQEGIRLCMSEEETVSICRDKRKCADILEDVCQTIPEIDRKNLDCFKDYPVICKRRDGRSSRGLHTFNTRKQLEAFLENHGEEYMIQPLIEGDIVTVDVVRDKEHDICVAFAREELLRTANGLGITVQVFHDGKFEELCRDIAGRLNILGCVNFEFIRDGGGNYYFMECNPRFSGGVEFSVLSGYDFIGNHLRCFMGECIDKNCTPAEQVIARKYASIIADKKSAGF